MVRITQSLLSDRTLFNLQQNINRLAGLQDQLSTGRRINRPADDPINFPNSLSRRTAIQLGRSHQINIDGARTNLELTETSLGSLTEVMQSVRTLAVQGASEDNDVGARLAIANQVRELYGQVLDLANANFNGQFIFGGSETRRPPFEGRDGTVVFIGDDFERAATIGRKTQVVTNVTGLQTFLHTPDQRTGTVRIQDVNAPLAEQLRLAHPAFPYLPPLPSAPPEATVDGSPNPQNSPTGLPNNYAEFFIHNRRIRVDLSADSLVDVVNRINHNVPDVVASINEDNQLVITSKRADALNLRDGDRDIGYLPDRPFGSNLLTALGLHARVENGRSLTVGYPAQDPLTDGTVSPTPQRNTVRVQNDSFLFAATNTGPAQQVAVPFADNLAISDVDTEGNERLNANDEPVFIDDMQAIRIQIDDEIIDIDLRGLTTGRDFDGTAGNGDDVPGSTLGDLIDLINNHPALQGRATAYINADQTGIGISASNSTDVFRVQNLRELFGRDITTRVVTDPLTGRQTISRIEPINIETKLADIPGALVDDTTLSSTGIRQGQPIPGIDLPEINMGLVSVSNNGQTATVDLREAVTIGDVLRAFNNAPVGIHAEINNSGTGINITSLVETSDSLSIRDMFDGTTVRDLGLFTPPPLTQVQSTNTVAFTAGQLISNAGVAPAATNGSFTIEVRDGSGATLQSYTIDVATTDSLGDLVEQIDAADGVSGPGGGLISANLEGGTLNIVSHFDGYTILVDPANDTTGVNAATRVTSQLGIDRYTVSREADIPQSFYSSDQNTASILGLNADGTADEVQEENLFRTIKNLEQALRQDDTDGIRQALTDMDIDLDKTLNVRTSLGARLNRLDAAQSNLQDSEDLVRQQLSSIEDADLAELISEMTLAQNAFNAALSSSSRILQQSLIDFLR